MSTNNTSNSTDLFVGTVFEPWHGYIACDSEAFCSSFLKDDSSMGACISFSKVENVPDGRWCSCSIEFYRFGENCNSARDIGLLGAMLLVVPMLLGAYTFFICGSSLRLMQWTFTLRKSSLILFLCFLANVAICVAVATRALLLTGHIHNIFFYEGAITLTATIISFIIDVCSFFWLEAAVNPVDRPQLRKLSAGFITISVALAWVALLTTFALGKTRLAAYAAMVVFWKDSLISIGFGYILREKLRAIESNSMALERKFAQGVLSLGKSVILFVVAFSVCTLVFVNVNTREQAKSVSGSGWELVCLWGNFTSALAFTYWVTDYSAASLRPKIFPAFVKPQEKKQKGEKPVLSVMV